MRPLAAWPRYKEPAAARSPPSFLLFCLLLLPPSLASLPAGRPLLACCAAASRPHSVAASQRHSARPLTGFLPLTGLPFPPSCSYSTLPLPVDPTVGLAVDGDPMHSPLYQTWWLAVHAMGPPSASCPWNLISSSTPRPTSPLPKAPASP
jgi:hypothetical protein